MNKRSVLPTSTAADIVLSDKLVEYTFSDFTLDLPRHWRRCALTEDNALHWHSPIDNASVSVSIDAHDLPREEAMQLADERLDARHHALEALAPGQVEVLQRSATPYPGGGGLELMYAAQLADQTRVYLGYITPKKIFNFELTCGPDMLEAAELFERFARERLRVKVP
jgi:hypothetical protein